MMTMLLPIPNKKQPTKIYYIPYNIKEKYVNRSGEVRVRSTETVAEFRSEFEAMYGVENGSYIITTVTDNRYSRFWSLRTPVENLL